MSIITYFSLINNFCIYNISYTANYIFYNKVISCVKDSVTSHCPLFLSTILTNTLLKEFYLTDPYPNEEDFRSWFIGFCEGDMSLCVKRVARKDRYIYLPAFALVLAIEDRHLLEYIKQKIGLGSSVRDFKNPIGVMMCALETSNQQEMYKLLSLFNGNLVLPKRQAQFKEVVEAFNVYYKRDIVLLPFLSFQDIRSTLLTSAWLSGFIDAEGSFIIKYTPDRESHHLSFIIRQKDSLMTLKTISECLLSSLNRSTTHTLFVYSALDGCETLNFTQSISKTKRNIKRVEKLSILTSYLNNYPLISNKRVAYEVWLNTYNLSLNSLQFTPEGFNTLLINYHFLRAFYCSNKYSPRDGVYLT